MVNILWGNRRMSIHLQKIIRFIPIVVLLGIPMICKIFSQSTYKTISFIITVVMILLSILFFYYQFIKTDLDKIKINIDNITDNIISIWH